MKKDNLEKSALLYTFFDRYIGPIINPPYATRINIRLALAIVIAGLWGGVCSTGFAQAPMRKYVRYYEYTKDSPTVFKSNGVASKDQRLSSNGGSIILSYDKSIPDSLQTALIAAKKLWEAKLHCSQPIFISVFFEPLEDNITMAADAGYVGRGDLDGYPTALEAQISGLSHSDSGSPDGLIFFNSDINWNCSFSEASSSGYNLPTLALIGIARCLGFGSSVIGDSENGYYYSNSSPTSFDKLLYSNNQSLSKIEEDSKAMADFVTSDNVYARTNSQAYKIFAPKQFVPDMSLRYFDDTTSLMSHLLGEGHVDLSIDEKTMDVLRAVGWDLPQAGLRISCADISDSGIGSSYSPHTFSLSTNGVKVSNHNWRFSLKDKSGNFTQLSKGSSENFTIPAISSTDGFFVNINGDLEGRVECDYTLNGARESAVPFSVSLELKPSIRFIDNVTAINNGPYEFSLRFDVYYAGADRISVEVEEEYSSFVSDFRIDEPYIAHVKTGNITNLYYSWVTVVVSNKYGTTTQTMEFAPVYMSQNADSAASGHETSVTTKSVKRIQLYKIDGSIVYDGDPAEFFNNTFPSGIYIRKETFINGQSTTSKYHVK